jgi:nifR3 family TIM-barrel protein
MANFWQTLPQPFTVLAPMEGVTDFAFRETVSKYLPKPDVMFTEFTNVDSLTSAGFDDAIQRFKFSSNQKPIVAQIWGTNPEAFYKSAQLVQKLKFDGIDINMGCPDRAVVKLGAGSAMINNPSLAKEVIEAVKKGADKLPISVKTRIGFKTVVTTEWITFLLEQKLDALTIHGRTAKQMSKAEINWNEIKKAVDIKNSISPNTLIIGNGDIDSYSEACNVSKKYGLNGVMIGRGIFKNPWVFDKSNDTKEHIKSEYISVLLKHMILNHKNNSCPKAFEPMKKFFKMYINNFKYASSIRQKLMETKTFDEAFELLKQI